MCPCQSTLTNKDVTNMRIMARPGPAPLLLGQSPALASIYRVYTVQILTSCFSTRGIGAPLPSASASWQSYCPKIFANHVLNNQNDYPRVQNTHHKFMRASYMKHFAKFLAILHHNASFFNFCFIINFGFIKNLLHILEILKYNLLLSLSLCY